MRVAIRRLIIGAITLTAAGALLSFFLMANNERPQVTNCDEAAALALQTCSGGLPLPASEMVSDMQRYCGIRDFSCRDIPPEMLGVPQVQARED
jgi:hypothetical protein